MRKKEMQNSQMNSSKNYGLSEMIGKMHNGFSRAKHFTMSNSQNPSGMFLALCIRFFLICECAYVSEFYSREIERSIPIPYCNLWKYFGVDVDLCDRSDIKMFLSMLLDCMVLEMPTINMQRHQNEDQDFEEEVHIKIRPIEIICHARHIVDIERTKYPLTMSLIGCNEQYFGKNLFHLLF